MNAQTNTVKSSLIFYGALILGLLIGFTTVKSCSGRNKARAAIRIVLIQDAVTSDGASSATEVVQRMRAIDTSPCPNDFKAAYLAHIQAWELMVNVEEQAIRSRQRNSSVGAYTEAFIRGFLGDPFGKIREVEAAEDDLARQAQAASQQIQSTFYHVRQIAMGHGINFAQGRN